MIRKTPLVTNDKYSAYTQNKVYLKLENLQKSGSIKIRAVANLVKSMEQEGYNHFIIASTGNQALALAYLCNEKNLKCSIVMPINTAYSKIKDLKDLNAKVVLSGINRKEAVACAKEIALEDKAYYIGEHNNEIMAQGYHALVAEIIEEQPDINIFVVPVGEGNLLRGIIEGLKKLNHQAKVYAIEPYHCATLYNQFHSLNGEVANVSIAESIRYKQIAPSNYDAIKESITNSFRVSDEELIDCFLDVCEEHKSLVETAGLVSLAGVKYLNEKNQNIVCILTGGNVDLTTMASLMEEGLKNKGRIFTFKTLLSDKPGELVEVASTIANNQGNIIGLKHNQLSLLTRQSKVELIVSVETFGLEHKFKIAHELEKKGYEIILLDEGDTYE
ncbi:MAG: pyridoxal-phosphate dependent enzyme [Bacilli bacterium]